MLKEARERAEMTQDMLADMIGCVRTTLSKYEAKDDAPYDVIKGYAEHCNAPELISWACKELCPIGQAYSYTRLNAIDYSLPAVILTGEEELKEALKALADLTKLMRNKGHRDDLVYDQQLKAEELLQQAMHDISRLTDIMKITLSKMGFDLAAGVKVNDLKAVKKGYIKKESAMRYAIADS